MNERVDNFDSSSMRKIYFDAEFTGLVKDSSLISIGMVTEDGNYFYGEFNDYKENMVTPWIQENVLDNLWFNGANRDVIIDKTSDDAPYNIMIKADSGTIKARLTDWLLTENRLSGKKIQFYCDCYAYDWVLLNDWLCPSGDALKLPEYIYYIPVDLSTALQMNKIDPDISRESFVSDFHKNVVRHHEPFSEFDTAKHNCLWDAVICMGCFQELNRIINMRKMASFVTGRIPRE